VRLAHFTNSYYIPCILFFFICIAILSATQFWESATGRIFSMTDFHMQQHHAGAASATDCPWFTDNPLIENWYHRNSTDDVFVVLIGTGSFTGA